MYIFNVNLETFIEVNLLNKTIKTSESYQTCRKADLTEHNGRSWGCLPRNEKISCIEKIPFQCIMQSAIY